METIPPHRVVVASARRLAPRRPVVVSPLTLKPRWRRAATGAPPAPAGGGMPFRPDARHGDALGASWLAGSLIALAQAGIASVTTFDLFGVTGLFAPSGGLTPAGRVLRELAPWASADLAATRHPGNISALPLTKSGRRCLLLASHGPAPLDLAIRGAWGDCAVALAPYDVRFIEFS